MMRKADDIGAYEGLVHSTAVRYAPILVDEPLDDLKQLLRIKVWRSRLAYSEERATQSEERFVFSCLANYVKDLLKAQTRRNVARGGHQRYIEDEMGEAPDVFAYTVGLVVEVEVVYAVVEEEMVRLPSTLTLLEQRVVRLLLIGDYTQPEMAVVLGVSTTAIKKAHAAIRVKMSDWKPTSVPELMAA